MRFDVSVYFKLLQPENIYFCTEISKGKHKCTYNTQVYEKRLGFSKKQLMKPEHTNNTDETDTK